MAGNDGYTLDTLALHAGHHPRSGPLAVPIHLTASYAFEDADEAAARFAMESAGPTYSRVSNPTTAVLEERIAALEGGIGAVATASGLAALHLAIATLMGAGSEIVASRAIYGGSRSLLEHTLPRFGITTRFVDPRDADAWRAAIGPATRLLYAEALGNPGLEVLDIPTVAAIAHANGLPLLVDATLATPCLLRPFDHGADLVLHSATKFLCGHGTALGGLVVDSGNFDWEGSGRFPTLTEPSPRFGGIDFAEESTVAAFLLRARREGLADFGACLSPLNAFQILQGIETLPLRMARHVANARRIAEFLVGEAGVERVAWPELPGHPDRDLARRLLPRGCGGVLSFDVPGGRTGGRAFVGALRVFTHAVSIGDARSLAIQPATTTHAQLSEAALDAIGVGPGTIRLAVGLEDPDDLIEDLGRGLQAARKAAGLDVR